MQEMEDRFRIVFRFEQPFGGIEAKTDALIVFSSSGIAQQGLVLAECLLGISRFGENPRQQHTRFTAFLRMAGGSQRRAVSRRRAGEIAFHEFQSFAFHAMPSEIGAKHLRAGHPGATPDDRLRSSRRRPLRDYSNPASPRNCANGSDG
jgi:hypothetical protein